MDLQKTGALIAAARKEKSLTQEQLAKQLHISHTTVSKWERGLVFPEVSLLEPLAAALGLTLPELFRGEQDVQTVQTEELVKEAVKAAVEEVQQKQRDARTNFFVLLFCLLLVIGMSVWAIVYVKNKPIDLDIRGTYQNTMIPIGDYGGRPEGGYLIQLAAQNWDGEQSFSLYINSCLVDEGNWEKVKPNLYRLTGEQCVLLVELHRDGSFYLQLPGLEEIILMNKLNDVPMYSGNQELWSDLKADYQKLLTGE